LLILLLGIMVCGTLGIGSAGFIAQVKLTGKPAAEVISAEESPGIESPN
jgi:hypothetical protein